MTSALEAAGIGFTVFFSLLGAVGVSPTMFYSLSEAAGIGSTMFYSWTLAGFNLDIRPAGWAITRFGPIGHNGCIRTGTGTYPVISTDQRTGTGSVPNYWDWL